MIRSELLMLAASFGFGGKIFYNALDGRKNIDHAHPSWGVECGTSLAAFAW